MSVDQPIFLASLDLGSNSFHLLISEWRDGVLREVKRHKDLVQLARAITDNGQLDQQAMQRAFASLRHCRQHLDQYPISHLRVVGTQILRQCRTPEAFILEAESILNAPIDIISGDEEASLVYQGVAAGLDPASRQGTTLVLDIGGASTEVITGENGDIQEKASLKLGCVTLANRFFTSRVKIERASFESSQAVAREVFLSIKPKFTRRPISRVKIERASFESSRAVAREVFLSIKPKFTRRPINLAVGASGTLRVLLDLLRFGSNARLDIGRSQIEHLIEDIIKTQFMSASLDDNLRWDVLPAGIAILSAFFDVFEFESVQVSSHSIKEGMMLDWISHNTHNSIIQDIL